MVSQELKQRFSVDGGVLEYEVVGAGEPVVLIHGALLDVPSGAQPGEVLGPVLQRYAAGDKAGAVDTFLHRAIGQD